MPSGRKYRLQRYGAVGDVLLVEPLLRELTCRGDRVTFVTSRPGAEVLANFPSPLLRISFNRNPFIRTAAKLTGSVTKLKYESLPGLHVQEAYARIAGVPGFKPSVPRLYLTDDERRSPIPAPYAVLHLQRNEMLDYRNVYGVDWSAVIDFLRARGLPAVQVGLEPEPNCGEHVRTRNLRELIRVLQGASLFVGLDSAPGHFAVGLGVPCVLFFGAVDPRLRLANLEEVEILQAPCDQAGCYHRFERRPGQKFVVCRRRDQNGLPICCQHTTEDVIQRIELALSRSPVR